MAKSAQAQPEPYQTLVHISDLHLHTLPWRPEHWLNKRAFGAANLLLRRRRHYPRRRVVQLVERLAAMDWELLVITGDLTQLGTEREFALAARLLAPLLGRGADKVVVVPGNHDRYLWPASPEQDGFARHFGRYFPPALRGSGHGAHMVRLSPVWHLAAWDATCPNRPLGAYGRVDERTLEQTGRYLKALPPEARLVVASHFPISFPPPHRYKAHHELTNLKQVQSWMKSHPVALYLHGHLHHNWVVRDDPPLQVNSAASAMRLQPGQTSSFHLIRLYESGRVEVIPQLLP